MVTVQMDADGVIAELKTIASNITKELSIVSFKAAKKGKSLAAKKITQELATPQKNVKKLLAAYRVGKTGAELTLAKTKRIPLRDFGARQTKKGVSYKISKTQGRKTIHGAFTGPRPGLTFARYGGRVFKRVGKTRLPIAQLHGPSPWGVFVKKKQTPVIRFELRVELRKQMAERLRYLKLKKSGVI